MATRTEKKKKKYKFSFNGMLNRVGHQSTAAISGSVLVTKRKRADGSLYVYSDVDFQISDCSRTIGLDFNIDSKNEFENSISKCNILINSLVEYKKALQEARDRYTKWSKESKEIDKK